MNSDQMKQHLASHKDNEAIRIRDLHRTELKQIARAVAKDLHKPHEMAFVQANVTELLKKAELEQKHFDAMVDEEHQRPKDEG
jgi:hypothetical protein